MSVIDDRLNHLQMIVEEGEQVRNDSFARKVRDHSQGIVACFELEHEDTEAVTNLFNACQKAIAELGYEGSFDPTDGDEAVKKVLGIDSADLWENQDQKLMGIDLVERWNKVKALNKNRKARTPRDPNAPDPNEPDFGFGTVATCLDCGKEIKEGSRTGATRWAHLKHLVKSHHGEHDGELMGDWKAGKEAFEKGETEVVIGQYRVSRMS